MSRNFGDQSYSLQDLFAEERHRIMRLLSQETLTRLDQLYTQVYRDNYGVLMAFHRDELAVPQELQVAAEVALSHRAMLSLRAFEQESSDRSTEISPTGLSHLAELEAIATEASHLHCKLNIPEAKPTLERLILRSLWHLLHNVDPATMEADLHRLHRLIQLGQVMHLGLSLAQAQELYFQQLKQWIIPACLDWLEAQTADRSTGQPEPLLPLAELRQLLEFGQTLCVDVAGWLDCLPV
jgi:alpha-amylase/alpha-mannosidase (GH57 family)